MKIMEPTYCSHRAYATYALFPCWHCGEREVNILRQGKAKNIFFCLACGAIDNGMETSPLRDPYNETFMAVRQKVLEARTIIDEAIEAYDPSTCFALLSGGHDSLVMSHVCFAHPHFVGHRFNHGALRGVAHINTGVGIEATRIFVRDICQYYDWPLSIWRAEDYTRADGTEDPQIYEELVTSWGFPGPGHHQKMYDRLKGRPINALVRKHKTHRMDKIALFSGVRQSESKRRMGYDDPVDVDGAKLWINPCFYWSKEDCKAYMATHILPINDVVTKLCMSGECLCGAFAKPGEMAIIQAEYPEDAARLLAIEDKVQQAGFPWRWDEAPPPWWTAHKAGQRFLPGLKPTAHLCSSCEHKSGH